MAGLWGTGDIQASWLGPLHLDCNRKGAVSLYTGAIEVYSTE